MTLVAAAAQLAARGAREREDAVLRLLSRASAAVGAYAVVQRLGWDPVLSLNELPTGARAVSTLGSPVDLGAYLALLVPAAIWRADRERGAEAWIAAALVAAGLAASGSRGAMAAAAIGTAAYALISRWDARRALRSSAALAVLLAAGAVAWACRAGASVSDQGRREVWKTSVNLFLARPWLGWGPDGFAEAFKLHRTDAFVTIAGANHYQAYAHNDLLHVLSSLGLPGTAAYFWLLAALLGAAAAALGAAKDRRLPAALCAGLLALWVNLQLNPVATEVWIAAALCAGLLVSLARADENAAFPRAVLVVPALLLSAGLLYAADSLRNDLVYKRGLRAHVAGRFAEARVTIARARRSRTCELSYLMGEFNAITDWINADRNVEARLALLALADADAREALACHPRLAMSHYIAAGSARIHYDLGFKERLADAAREYDAALALDPKFGPLLDARAGVTRLQSQSSSR
ncbi:MAG: O-antigen ligase family protein [Elusimicrobiota bacterium]|nr:MAG: O-antigen ligase family protein [Elusimicrobiota bacterium]